MTEAEIIQAFQEMWGTFPEPVTITQRSREIVAVNAKAQELGLKPGIKCSSIGSPQQHKGCKCNQALDAKSPVCVTYQGPLGKSFGYWIPIPAKPEWVLHFSVGNLPVYEEMQVTTDLQPGADK